MPYSKQMEGIFKSRMSWNSQLGAFGGRLFSIHSVNSDRKLIFSSYQGEQFQVEIKGTGISALTGVWIGGKLYSQSLDAFFQQLATFTKPWKGSQDWKSLEGEISLSATCATLGQVTFLIEIRHEIGGPEAWLVQSRIVTELGQLGKIARDAKTFFQEQSA
jgi:hypothetical protein